MRHNPRQRITAVLLALLAHAGVVALFIESRSVPHAREEMESIRLVFIQPVQMRRPVPPLQNKAPAAGRARVAPIESMEPLGSIEPAEPPEITRAITVAPVAPPRIDWYQQMAIAARVAADKLEELQRENPLDSKPGVLVLPRDRSDETATVKATRLDNGDLVTEYKLSDKLTVKCVYQHVRLSEIFDITAQHLPPNCYGVDTRPSLAPMVEAVKPDYLRRPLPLPKSPQTRGAPATPGPADKTEVVDPR